MSKQTLDAEIKTRVPANLKKAFEDLAETRHLDVADVAREAFREFLAKNIALSGTKSQQKKAA